MLRTEFENILIQLDDTVNLSSITDSDYSMIELVYMYHPSIKSDNSKLQIAHLYLDYGMTVIYDMVPRSKLLESKEKELNSAIAQVARIKEEIGDIKRGITHDN